MTLSPRRWLMVALVFLATLIGLLTVLYAYAD